jgi:hypothetical protein
MTDAPYISGRRPDEVRVGLTRWSEHVARLVGERVAASVTPIRAKRP